MRPVSHQAVVPRIGNEAAKIVEKIKMSGASDTAQATEQITAWAVLNGTEGVPSFSALHDRRSHQRRAQAMTGKTPASGVSQCDGLHCLLGGVGRRREQTRANSKSRQSFYQVGESTHPCQPAMWSVHHSRGVIVSPFRPGCQGGLCSLPEQLANGPLTTCRRCLAGLQGCSSVWERPRFGWII